MERRRGGEEERWRGGEGELRGGGEEERRGGKGARGVTVKLFSKISFKLNSKTFGQNR